MKTCYMCEKLATSKEHVPPACLFPEQKDSPKGKDYRKNLITVRSCDEHNLKKSNDDEYLMGVILWHIDNNKVAHHHIDSKFRRAHRLNPKKFDFLETGGKSMINGVLTDTLKVDANRLKNEIEHIARALYFVEFSKKCTAPLKVITPSIALSEESKKDFLDNSLRQEMKSMMSRYMENHHKKGDNPEIFYYQFDKSTEIDWWILKMVFYEGFEVYVNTLSEDTN